MKKLISAIIAAAMIVTSQITSFRAENSMSASATTANVLIGDANNSGTVNISDAVYIQQYLRGKYNPTALQVTSMDVNSDYVIDQTDATIISHWDAIRYASTRTWKTLYTRPNLETRSYYYWRRNTSSSYYLNTNNTYTINPFTENNNLEYDDVPEMASIGDYYDVENTNVIALYNNGEFAGSGFVVSSHVIATAAHCVYERGDSRKFKGNLKVRIYDNDGTIYPQNDDNLLLECNVQEIHIPTEYADIDSNNYSSQNIYIDNYDYALIYVNNNLSSYVTPWKFAIAVNEFSNSGMSVTSSGFRWYHPSEDVNILSRYFSHGTIDNIPNDSHNIPTYRLTSTSATHTGKSGGVLYCRINAELSDYTSPYTKSAIGVITGGVDNYYQNDIGGPTWATKITPTLLRFYLQNNHFNS